MDNAFEQAFDAFLEDKTYDEAEQALFSVIRAAFLAGWDAAQSTQYGILREVKKAPEPPSYT